METVSGKVSDELVVTGLLVPFLPMLYLITTNFWFVAGINFFGGVVWGGLANGDFGKFVTVKNGRLTAKAEDPVGQGLLPHQVMSGGAERRQAVVVDQVGAVDRGHAGPLTGRRCRWRLPARPAGG